MRTIEIKSPLPGTFYRASSPDTPPFKADGDTVAEGNIIGLIEVMKTFQEIPAGVSGGAIRFLVDNEEPVMAGQVIAEVTA
ncbi:biotin carboxyl carrier domain-containing protein [Phyllobacterium salinisoli]|uniref:Biotin carboxyl carrier protein of acetyl-CoA carboxylase n=1 Tax=Phyllobacterium salinisoli TaxID=1899321 RepID=A0A368JXT0_9HYPH|nr:acetyl-CoA carboxylase [Phyllobacterium salinisoli]RCS21761.1 biotin carboxyl carrier domain-containing protein [Phyllobacterium salinisoli]